MSSNRKWGWKFVSGSLSFSFLTRSLFSIALAWLLSGLNCFCSFVWDFLFRRSTEQVVFFFQKRNKGVNEKKLWICVCTRCTTRYTRTDTHIQLFLPQIRLNDYIKEAHTVCHKRETFSEHPKWSQIRFECLSGWPEMETNHAIFEECNLALLKLNFQTQIEY